MGKFVEAYFPPGAWWVGQILEMRGDELFIKWHGAIPSWIDAEGEFSAPDEEKLVRILGFQQPSEMGPFSMDISEVSPACLLFPASISCVTSRWLRRGPWSTATIKCS